MSDLEAADPLEEGKISSTGHNGDSGAPPASPALIGLFNKPPGNDDKENGNNDDATEQVPTPEINPQHDTEAFVPIQADSKLVAVDEESPLLVPALERASTVRINGGHKSQEYYTSTFSTEPIKPADFLGKKTEFPNTDKNASENVDEIVKNLKSFMGEFLVPNTWVGGAMFVLYHTLCCLTMGSSIIRLDGSTALLGLISKMATIGIIFASPVYWWTTKGEILALYPTVDLFAAPFLAHITQALDGTLISDPAIQELDPQESDMIFVGSFTVVAVLSVALSGLLVVLASVFKMANLGSFLPFPVLAGFFTATSILTWLLAFKIDTGMTVGELIFDSNLQSWVHCLLHHSPSLVSGFLMKTFAPKNSFVVIIVMFATTTIFYIVMYSIGYDREIAIEDGWFWGKSDLTYPPLRAPIGFSKWVSPAIFGWINGIVGYKYIHWGAVISALNPAIALSFLYAIRMTLQCSAVMKNAPNLIRAESPTNSSTTSTQLVSSMRDLFSPTEPSFAPLSRRFSERLDDDPQYRQKTERPEADNPQNGVMVQAPLPNLTMKEFMWSTGVTLLFNALLGGFAIVPSATLQRTMYKLRAEKIAPQILATVFLLGFYLFDFRFVGYIPKTVFSSLLCSQLFDTFDSWVLKSYRKTKEKYEWLVAPLIAVLAFLIGMLQSVFLGIALSTFFFVASFFRSGVVKFFATGKSIRSTIERTPKCAQWLDENGDLIPLFVLQNYLFFGNASTVLTFIVTLFQEEPEDATEDQDSIPPKPKIIILDLSLCSGIDTSAIDIFSEIRNACKKNDCRLFLAGVPLPIRQSMQLGDFKADKHKPGEKSTLRFFPDIDSAIGKAEDIMLNEFEVDDDFTDTDNPSFTHALDQIDQQHDLHCTKDLVELEEFVQEIHVDQGQVLYEDIEVDRGLWFIGSGVIKVQQDAENTVVTRTGTRTNLTGGRSSYTGNGRSFGSLTSLKVRSMALGLSSQSGRPFRLARIGAGWILGMGESQTGESNPGQYVAVTDCVLHHISYEKLEALEESHPRLILKLQKVLAQLMAKRQTNTISQLATMHSIMSAPAIKHAIRRSHSNTHTSF